MSSESKGATKLKQIRVSLQKTQCQMAEELYIQQSTYSKLETGQTQISFAIMEILFRKFNIPPTFWFERSM